MPYTPAGGLGTNGTVPRYMVESDWDFGSIALGVYQEYIELDLFHDGLARFSDHEVRDAGLTPEVRSLVQFMAKQEAGQATLLSNMLGEAAPKQCVYDYPYTTVRKWVDFVQCVTRFVEVRQQIIFRQLLGLAPMPVWFENGWPQSWQWTMLAPYISYCPEGTTRLAWQKFPTLRILDSSNIDRLVPNSTKQDGSETVGDQITDPSLSNQTGTDGCVTAQRIGSNCAPNLARNRSEPLSHPGKIVHFE
ncbi:hypothetical protein BJX76DRAFT_361151 [Aspergillus varians]